MDARYSVQVVRAYRYQSTFPCQIHVQLILQVNERSIACWSELDASEDSASKVRSYLLDLAAYHISMTAVLLCLTS